MGVRSLTRWMVIGLASALLAACSSSGSSSGDTATAPSITTQPGNVAVDDGGSATFTVAASGTGLAYQWRRGTTTIGGATAASYTLNPATLADNGATFSVVVSNSGGGVTSSDATLTVNAVAPTITMQPSDATRAVGAAVTFDVIAAGSAPLSYQWQRNGTDISGATSSSYTISSVQPANQGDEYTVVVTNVAGSATSGAATLTVTVTAIPPTISAQPQSQTVLQNASATFTVTASGSAPLSYQWRRNGVDISGANSNSYTLSSAAYPGDNGAVFTVVVSGAGSVTSDPATLTVTQTVFAPVIATDPASTNVLEGDQATFSFTLQSGTGTAPLSYQWRENGVDILGATSAALTFTASYTSHNGKQYGVIVSNSAGSDTSAAATLTVTQTALSVLAGNPGASGALDGTGSGARFNFPAGVAVDATSGDAYVADYANQTIRKITAAGVVTTLAGSRGDIGSADGAGNVARFNNPRGVAVDSAGNVYVADSGGGSIRRITSAGVVSTLATGLNVPVAVAVSGSGASDVLYVVEAVAHQVRAYTLTGTSLGIVTGTGSPGSANGTLAAATYNVPLGLAVDPGALDAVATDDVLYIADSDNTVIRKADRTSDAVTTLAGTVGAFGADDGDAATATFSYPTGVALVGDSATGFLYTVDNSGHRVRKIDFTAGSASPNFVTTLAGTGTAGNDNGAGATATFSQPFGIAVNTAGDLLVTDYGSNVIRKIAAVTTAPTVSNFAGDPATRGSANGTGSAALFNYPRGVATDSAGNTFVADSLNHMIRMVTPAGVTSTVAGLPGQIGGIGTDGPVASARFNNPAGVAVTADGNTVYVADYANNAIRMINGGNVSTIADTGDGVAGPRGVALSSDGSLLYVANTGSHTILEIDLLNSNTVTVIGGTTGSPGSLGDGAAATAATFNQPVAVAVDGTSYLYVSDAGNFRIRRIDLGNGNVEAFVGDDGNAGTANGTGAAAQFNAVEGLIVDSAGNVYAADAVTHQVRKATPVGVVTTVVGSSAIGVDPGALPGALNYPSGVAIDPTQPGLRLVISDGVEHAILRAIVTP